VTGSSPGPPSTQPRSSTAPPSSEPWSGRWVADALGVTVETDQPGGEAGSLTVPDLVGMALRRNPRRAHLLVSTVLGKHLPADPRLVYGAGRLLGAMVADRLAGTATGVAASGAALLRSALTADPGTDAKLLIELCRRHREAAGGPDARALVFGYAETATALGHCVAESLGADYLHSTRRAVAGFEAVARFEEEHSHATSHLLLPGNPDWFARPWPLVLVDDELSTGRTVLNTIEALHRSWPRRRYLIASLVDLRPAADRAALRAHAERLGVDIEVVTLGSGRLVSAGDSAAAAQRLVAEHAEHPRPAGARASRRPQLVQWPAELAEGGRHGFEGRCQPAFEQAVTELATTLADRLRECEQVAGARRILVLGSEELMYAPLRIGTELARQFDGEAVIRYSSTTRSPVLAVNDPGYAIRNRLSFISQDGVPAPRFAYNIAGHAPQERFTDIVAVIDTEPVDDAGGGQDAGSLLDQLASVTDRLYVVRLPVHRPTPPNTVLANTVPANTVPANTVPANTVPARAVLPSPLVGPDFGSYPAADVAWLLTDLSGAALEAPTEEREEAIQSGSAHYAESLPQEYQPTPEYRQLFADALAESARRLAHEVGVVTELVLDRRGPAVVLASLARAGTPVGVLMRRWAWYAHRLDVRHYAVSIVRARGIDEVALAYLAEHHDPADVMFVDGWTGKGAITRELAAAVARFNQLRRWPPGRGFAAELAVLADPGSCVDIYGTRADYLIPSACLNSTVSGLVSRTVLNAALIGPGQFHGAKFYAELTSADVSLDFLDAVTAEFEAVSTTVARSWPVLRESDRRPTWAGWQSVRRLSAEYGIDDENLVKPGVGETTRVLLRRVPWKILIRTGEAGRLHHVLMLARQRGVEVESVDDLAFSCVGLIHPRFGRNAIEDAIEEARVRKAAPAGRTP